MKVDRFRLAAWLVSGLCLATSAGVIVNRHAAFMDAARRKDRAATDLQSAREESQAVAKRPHDAHYACAPRSASEETAFLIDLRRRAHDSGVSIARWSSRSTTYKKSEYAPADASDRVIEGVTKVSCDLQLDGTYPALRAFVRDLGSADRLFSLSNVEWNRTKEGSQLAMTLNRYLAPLASSASSTDASKGPSAS